MILHLHLRIGIEVLLLWRMGEDLQWKASVGEYKIRMSPLKQSLSERIERMDKNHITIYAVNKNEQILQRGLTPGRTL